MIYNVYAIRDNLTHFLSLTLDENDASATRNFRHAMMNPQSLMHTHPKDYDLYRLARFDTETGMIQDIDKVLVAAGASLEV